MLAEVTDHKRGRGLALQGLALGVWLLGVGCAPRVMQAPQPAEVAYVDSTLWIRATQGRLFSARRGEAPSERRLPGQTLVDLNQTAHGQLWLLTADAERGGAAALWELRGGEFRAIAPDYSALSAPEPWALSDRAGRPVLLTKTALFFPAEKRMRPKRYPVPDLLQGGALSFVATITGVSYLGSNAGERGGVFSRVDEQSGAFTPVPRGAGSSDSRGSPDPITAVVRDWESPHCVLAAEGVLHADARGRLLRVCGGSADVVEGPWSGLPVVDTTQNVVRALTPQPPGRRDQGLRQEGDLSCLFDPDNCPGALLSATPRPAPTQGQAISSLSSNKAGVWVATPQNIYYRTAETVEAFPTPEPADGAELSIAWAADHVVVSTPLDAARPERGFTPLVAATTEGRPAALVAKQPVGTCWRTTNEPATILCFEADRYFLGIGEQWHSSLLSWERAEGGGLHALIPGGEILIVLPRGNQLSLRLRGWPARRAELSSLRDGPSADGALLRRARAAIKQLPDVAEVPASCGLRRRGGRGQRRGEAAGATRSEDLPGLARVAPG